MENVIAYFVSTLMGVIIGTLINITVNRFGEKKRFKKKKKYFKDEIELNISKIDEWLGGIEEYRNYTSSNTLELFNYYFDLKSFLSNAALLLFKTGEIYDVLSNEDIKDYQIVAQECTINWENILNEEVSKNKKNFDQKETIQNVMFWKQKFENHKKTLQRIYSNIK